MSETPDNVTKFPDRSPATCLLTARVSAAWVHRLAPFATPDDAFTNPSYKGLLVQPAPNGGVFLTATDGCIIVRAHDQKGEASAAFWLRLRPSLVRACKAPQPPRLLSCDQGRFDCPMPDYLLPGDVVVHITRHGGHGADDQMELVYVAPKAPAPGIDPMQDEGGAFYSRFSSKGQPLGEYREARLTKSVWDGFDKVLRQANDSCPDSPMESDIALNGYYLSLLGKLGKQVGRAARFRFHGPEAMVGVTFFQDKEDTAEPVRAAVMPMRVGQADERAPRETLPAGVL